MLESSVNQVALAQRQSQGADNQARQQEARRVESTVEEQASAAPVATSGVSSRDVQETSVASQPADVVTRLGETQENVSLYEPTKQTGTVIRPSISVEDAATYTQQRQTEAVEVADDEDKAAAVREQDQVKIEEETNQAAATPSAPQRDWTNDIDQLV